MKNISLLKVTAFVVTAAFGSNFVNADDKVNQAIEQANAEAPKVEASAVAEQLQFSSLLEKLDNDKNGTLSVSEVSANQSKLLLEEFTKMDVNQDKEIDETEYNNYLAKVSDKVSTVVKSTI